MKRCNLIAVFSPDGEKWLMCKRVKPPFEGKYNLVGGRIEEGETSLEAAYRELFEETGIRRDQIELTHMLDSAYHWSGWFLEFWAGQLTEEVTLREELNPLSWQALDQNFFDMERFAGTGNLGHFLAQLRESGMPRKR